MFPLRSHSVVFYFQSGAGREAEQVTKTEDGEVYENKIEELFYEYCYENDIDTTKHNIDDNDAFCIWRYIYIHLFKPDAETIRLNNKTSKLDYDDITGLHAILDIYIGLCYKYKILPLIGDFCTLTGITRETLNSWEHGEYRARKSENATYKHSEIAKKIKDATKHMTVKNLNGNAMGQMALANNFDEAGLMFSRQEAQAKAEAWLLPRERPGEIMQRRRTEIPEKPDFDGE